MKFRTFDTRKKERGNALFLILIAVALFAALSYAVTQSGRSGSGGASREMATINAGLITDFAASVGTTTTRMILMNTSTAATTSFRYSQLSEAPAVTTLGVFHSSGGGAVYVTPPTAAVGAAASATEAGPNWRFKAYRADASGHYVDGIGTASADAFAMLGLNLATCQAINAGLLGSANQTPLVETNAFDTTLPTLVGSLTQLETEASPAVADDTADVTGNDTRIGKGHTASPQSFACIANSADATAAPYIYYHTLIEN
jgi:hypothetical protein